METEYPPSALSALSMAGFACISSVRFESPSARRYADGQHESIFLETVTASGVADCCEICARTDRCTGCSYGNGTCTLGRAQELEDLPDTTHMWLPYRMRFQTQSGCACSATSGASPTCSANYQCNVESNCITGNHLGSFCNGEFHQAYTVGFVRSGLTRTIYTQCYRYQSLPPSSRYRERQTRLLLKYSTRT